MPVNTRQTFQSSGFEMCLQCFLQETGSERLQDARVVLVSSASRLRDECKSWPPTQEQDSNPDFRLKTQQVIQYAYDIAKAAKKLVTLFQWVVSTETPAIFVNMWNFERMSVLNLWVCEAIFVNTWNYERMFVLNLQVCEAIFVITWNYERMFVLNLRVCEAGFNVQDLE